MTVGDSPNDESLFDNTLFPLSVGVANLAEYLPLLTHHPAYLTDLPESEGFCELVRAILASQLP
jgi:hydroxymethylpyrimidine pyrophosphatase-like HAD family hydrolase